MNAWLGGEFIDPKTVANELDVQSGGCFCCKDANFNTENRSTPKNFARLRLVLQERFNRNNIDRPQLRPTVKLFKQPSFFEADWRTCIVGAWTHDNNPHSFVEASHSIANFLEGVTRN